ncbi:MAG: tetratricopeptide repeat protein [Hyphomicrobiaceae bacterium]|nr:tetratricopeptide repeat protein [Hyphomicrobiaceae bacterium]
MRTSDRLLGLVLAMGLAVLVPVAPSARAAVPEFTSPEEALRQGVSAYTGGYYEIAIPALEHAASRNLFLGQYFLAKLYADNGSAHTDHSKAFVLFQKIANEHADADPEDDQRAPYVARSMTALAGYVRVGLPELGVRPDPVRAADYLHHAAIFFNDEDAQFELAKMLLRGEGVRADAPRARHWLATLAQKGHAGAQAFLADLLWRGKFMPHDPVRALALISVAAKNAPQEDEVWIHDIYQNIYCGAAEGVRSQVDGMVAEWDTRYGRRPNTQDDSGLGTLGANASRTCADGRVVPMVLGGPKHPETAAPALPSALPGAAPSRPLDARGPGAGPGPALDALATSSGGQPQPGAPSMGFMSGDVGGTGGSLRSVGSPSR